MGLEIFPKMGKKRRMVSMRFSEQALEWLDYLKEHTNAPGRERVLEQLIHDAYVEMQNRLKGIPDKSRARPKAK